MSFEQQQDLSGHVIKTLGEAVNRVFRTAKTQTLFVGNNPITRFLASELNLLDDRAVVLHLTGDGEISDETSRFVRAASAALSDNELLEHVHADNARCLVAVLKDDERNLSLCREALKCFHVPSAVGRLGLVAGMTTWARVSERGMFRLKWRDVIEVLVPEMNLTAGLLRVARAEDREQIAEVEILLPVFVGRMTCDLPLYECDVIGLTRQRVTITEYDDTPLEMGDVVTVIGTKPALQRVREAFVSL